MKPFKRNRAYYVEKYGEPDNVWDKYGFYQGVILCWEGFEVTLYDKGSVQECYIANGNFHRENGPALIEYDGKGNLSRVDFYVKDIPRYIHWMLEEYPQHKKELLKWL